MTLFIKIDLIW